MADNVVQAFGPHTNMSVEECLEFCRRHHGEYQDVVVIGYDHDGGLVVRSSAMSRWDANWMFDMAKLHALKLLED